MTQEHPITPPPELLSRWEEDWHYAKVKHIELEDHIAHQIGINWARDALHVLANELESQ